MLSTIKTRIYKYADLSREVLTQLKAWLKRTPSSFVVENLTNPSTRIVQVTNAAGQVLCFCPVEQAVILNPPLFNPKATGVEQFSAGATIEEALAHEAELSGASKLLMVIPSNYPNFPGERWIRVVERRITPLVATHMSSQTTTPPSNFLN